MDHKLARVIGQELMDIGFINQDASLSAVANAIEGACPDYDVNHDLSEEGTGFSKVIRKIIKLVDILKFMRLSLRELREQTRIQRLMLRKIDEVAMQNWLKETRGELTAQDEPFRIPDDLIREE